MRYAVLIALVLLAGCGGEPRPAPEAHAPGEVQAPAFSASLDEVQNAVVRAIVHEYGTVTLDDRAAHRVEAVISSRSVAAEIRPGANGLTEVGIASLAVSHTIAENRLRDLVARISLEMSRPSAAR